MEALYEEIVFRNEAKITLQGPIVANTGQHTGRSASDKVVVRESESEDKVWWGQYNRPLAPDKFDELYGRMQGFFQGRDLSVQDCYVGADPEFRMPIRIITERAWHSMFARNMFIQAKAEELADHEPQFTVLNAPNFHAVPEVDGTRSEVFIVIHFGQKLVLIGGTQYAGEIKKSIFTVMNYLLPQKQVLSMHCSANMGTKGDVAILFGRAAECKKILPDAGRGLFSVRYVPVR